MQGGDAAAAQSAAVRFGPAARQLELTVARFGRVSLSFAGVLMATRPAADESIWRLRRPGVAAADSQGWLVIGHATGLRIVSAILGIPGPRVHRALGTTERGVLAAAISAIIRHAPGLALAGARPDEWSGSGLARIEGWAESETFRETFFLDLPPSWLPEAEPAAIRARVQASGLPLSLPIELARTTITAEEWSRARPGDAVVFDAGAGPLAGAPRPALLRCGAFAAPATWAPPELRLTGGFAPLAFPERTPMPNDPDRDITTTVLAAAPIDVVAELGRLTLRADEVAALKAGSVVTLPPKAETRIELRIGGRLWARGELVDVGGQLAVRLISVESAARGDSADADTLR